MKEKINQIFEQKRIYCKDCKHKTILHHTHHISCNFINSQEHKFALFGFLIEFGTIPLNISIKIEKVQYTIPFIEIDLHGLKNGWANWPLEFDPIWIKCNIGVKRENNI